MNPKSTFYFLLILIIANQVNISKSYCQTHSKEVLTLKQKSINIDPDNFASESVINHLDKIFEGKQIVLLGEQNHRDGSTFKFYSHFVKLLHSRYGFEAILFESGFYDCHKAWEQIQNHGDPYIAFRQSIFPLWSMSEQAQPLFEYIKEQSDSSNPLEVAGFDCQITGSLGISNFLIELDSIVRHLDSEYSVSLEYKKFLQTASNATSFENTRTINEEDLTSFHNTLERISSLLISSRNSSYLFWHQNLKNLDVNISLRQGISKGTFSREHINMRDKQMADNVKWYLGGPLKGKKIILWGNISHFLKNATSMIPTSGRDLFDGAITMGDYLYQDYGNKIYLIGSISYDGEAGYTNRNEKELVPVGSLNHMFHLTDQKVFFIDLNQFEETNNALSEPIESRLDGSISFKADWTKVFDGILYIDFMEANKRIEE